MSTQLILALDVPTKEQAAPILKQLRGTLQWVKIGLQMFTAYGPDYVRQIADDGFNIFLDLKLHDIPNTVAKSVESISVLPVQMLTIHTLGGREMMQSAIAAQKSHNPKLQLLGVTILTSMDDPALTEIGISTNTAAQVARLAQLATASGMSGLVCSPHELPTLRQLLPTDTILVTPGIRPDTPRPADDQKRTMTPSQAAHLKSSYIVVGRPILSAKSPLEATQQIQSQLTQPS